MKNLEKIFQISSLQTLFIVFYLIISLMIITLLFVKKVQWNKILLTSLSIGILGGISVYFLNINKSVNVDEAYIWLNMIPDIFIYFSLFFSPLLLGIKIIHLFLNDEKNRRIGMKFFLNVIVTFSIIIIMIPLLGFIKFGEFAKKGIIDHQHKVGLISWLLSSNVSQWYWSLLVFIFILIISLLCGIVLSVIKRKKGKDLTQTTDIFSGLKMLLESSISFISKLLPLVIISIIPIMIISHSTTLKNIKSLLIFIGMFIGFGTLLFSLLFLINKNEKFRLENISLIIDSLFFPIIVGIITYLNYNCFNYKMIAFIFLIFSIGSLNYLTFYKELEHDDNFVETSMERSSIIILGSFTLISYIYLYLLIIKPILVIVRASFNKLIKPMYEFILSSLKNKGGVLNE